LTDMAISPRVPMVARGMREPANGLTHLAGVLLSLAALVALVGWHSKFTA